MGGVAVLHPQDVLNYNRMPLISSRGRNNPNFIPNSDYNPKSVPNSNLKSVSNSNNRRKRSPQKKNNDVSRSPPSKSSYLGQNFEGMNGVSRPSQKGVVGNLSRGKMNGAQKLEMGKVKILKRGEALTNDEKAEKKTVSFDDEKTVILRENYEKVVDLKENDSRVVDLRQSDVKMVSLKENNEKMVDLKKNDDDDLKSIEMMLMRWGPEPEMVPRQINLADFYAGSAFVTSPDPSSVPVPDFFKKKTPEVDPSSHLRMLLKITF